MATQKKRVYLAGKVGGIKHKIAEQVDSDFVEFVCSDGGDHSEHGWGNGLGESAYYQLRDQVKEHFIDQIATCEFLIAILDKPDSFGSIAEIAYASARGLTCLVIIYYFEDSARNEEMRDSYWFVGNFPNVRVDRVLSDSSALSLARVYCMCESVMELHFFFSLCVDAPELARRLLPQAKFPTGSFTYRVDFLYEYEGRRIAIEVDGHDSHKTKEQRTHDARKDRYLKSVGVEVVRFTGTELHNEIARCMQEFIKLVQ